MKKVALVFVVAVFVPSLVLAWLAVRSLRDQQVVLERQQAQLYQNVTDSVAREINEYLAGQQRHFDELVETLVTNTQPQASAGSFDVRLRALWPVAEVGFCVTLGGSLLCPSPTASPEAQLFCRDNGSFLGNNEVAEVYRNTAIYNVGNNLGQMQWDGSANQSIAFNNQTAADPANNGLPATNYGKIQNRKVNPVQLGAQNWIQSKEISSQEPNISKVVPSEAQFRQLIGEEANGMMARFLQNKLRLMFWHRLERDPQLVYGVQLNLEAVRSALQAMLSAKEPVASDSLRARGSSWEYAPAGTRQAFSGPVLPRDGALVILDDNAVPVAATDEKLMQVARKKQWLTADAPRFDFKHPLVATEIGESLPHWEVAAYLRNPESLKRTARTIQLTLGLLVAALISAIGVGGWLIVHDLNRQLALARQKTDFVSNVSHELKTPLTSIRMFAELLAEGRVSEPAKQRSYLNIITAEASRLTRLINNVLDFARIERGQKKYNFAGCDLVALATETAATLRPHLESAGFKFEVVLLASSITVHADRDAVAQVIVNLLSNAEKYSNGMKEITMELERRGPTDGVGTRNQNQGESKAPAGVVELRVLDRGPGVPGVCEERIFEQFFRVNDSLTNAVPGSGLGLTLARQIARAHGGDVTYAAREGGGSVFTLQLPERNQQSS